MGNTHCKVQLQEILDFCTCVDKFIKDNDYIFLYLYDNKLNLYASKNGNVSVEFEVIGNGTFKCGVDSVKFIQTIKNLREDSVNITFKSNKITIKNSNIVSNIMIIEYHEPLSFPEFISIGDEFKNWIVDSISKCSFAITSVFGSDKGVLIDFNKKLTRVCRISNSSVRIITGNFNFQSYLRIVIHEDMVKIISSFKSQINSIWINENKLGILFKNNIFAYAPLLYDNYPKDYLSSLRLLNESIIINHDNYDAYTFNKEEIVKAINTVSVVLGEDGLFVNFNCIGASKKEKYPVWDISGSSLNGCNIKETIMCSESGMINPISFKINRKDSINVMKTYNDTITILNNNDKPLVITDKGGHDIVLLSKVAN